MPVYELHFTREASLYVREPAHPSPKLTDAIRAELDRLNMTDINPPWKCVVQPGAGVVATHTVTPDGKFESLGD